MKIHDHLSQNTLEQLNKMKRRRRNRNKNKLKKDPLKQQYSEGFIKSLMWDGDTYGRGRGGAIRRK